MHVDKLNYVGQIPTFITFLEVDVDSKNKVEKAFAEDSYRNVVKTTYECAIDRNSLLLKAFWYLLYF